MRARPTRQTGPAQTFSRRQPNPGMTTYPWRCQACDQVNPAGTTRCTQCDCPASPDTPTIEAHAARFKALGARRFACAKCDSDQYKVGELRASGGLLSSVLEVESEKFSYIACARCGYTELYRGDRSVLRQLFDFGI